MTERYSKGSAQLTTLISNDILSRLEQMRINAKRRFTDRRAGEHLSGRTGMSTEFVDYRDYVVGDDIRKIDWNIFSRLRKPYIKLFHEEREIKNVIIIDNSSSMALEEKIQRAQQLAISFGLMSLMAGERVSVFVTNGDNIRNQYLKPLGGRAHLQKLIFFIESINAQGNDPLETGIKEYLNFHLGHGLVIILSDFFSFGNIKILLNRLFNAGLEIFGVQILSPHEIEPELSGDCQLVDCEIGRTLDVTLNTELFNLYHQYRLTLESRLTEWCQQRSGRFISINSQTPLNNILFDTFIRKGWIR